MRFNTTADGRLETVETVHDVEERERQLRAAIARDRGTLRRMLDGNEPFHCEPAAVAGETVTHTGGPCTLQNLPKPADQWKTENPPVPGVYVTRWDRNPAANRHWDGSKWSQASPSAAVRGGVRQTDQHRKQSAVKWLRLIEADPIVTSYPWLRGDEVPEAERAGLWFCRGSVGNVGTAGAQPASLWQFASTCMYRRAAPGTKEGDPYNEAAYAGVAG